MRSQSHRTNANAPNKLASRPPACHVKFKLHSKNDLYLVFADTLYRDEGDSLRFSYPSDHPLAAEFEEQMTAWAKEFGA